MARNELTPQELLLRKTISNNIKKLAELKNKNQSDISKELKIPKTTLNGYFNASSTPNSGNIQKLADYFGVKKSELDPRFIQEPTNLIEINETVKIPVLGTIACGEPILADENILEYRNTFNHNLPTGELFYLKAKGDSMTPSIPDSSYVLIRRQEEVENGEIAAVLINGDTEATLKKVRRLGNNILLEAINEEYAPYLINEENPARIIGKAVKVEYNL